MRDKAVKRHTEAGGGVGHAFDTDAKRWNAVARRDPRADGVFFYGVLTTGVYCRPTCPSRVPNRRNVVFFENREEAQSTGFRPCKRCEPERDPSERFHASAVLRACRMIEGSEKSLSLKELSESVGISPSHFNRVFKRIVGVTPKEYGAAKRTKRFIDSLSSGRSVTRSMYDAGYGSPSRLYERDAKMLCITPSMYKKGGRGLEIRYSLADTSLGPLLVAASERGVCAVEFGESRTELTDRLRKRFPHARLNESGTAFAGWVAAIASFIETPRGGLSLPLDVRGTAFQLRVWRALRKIPPGAVMSYGEIARRVGSPNASRAVGRACAENPASIVIPCHRVVRADGASGGYRWGVKRKLVLLDRERKVNPPAGRNQPENTEERTRHRKKNAPP